MMETIKRNLFLVALGGGVAVAAVAVGVITYFVHVRPNARLMELYRATRARAETVRSAPIFTPELVAEMARQVDLRKKQYEDVLNFIRRAGAARKPLLDGVFPSTTDTGKRLSFKSEYDAALARFMKRLGAVPPPGSDKEAGRVEEEGAMFVHPRLSFYRPDWVDRPEAPNMDLVRLGQENIWLMEDLVGIIEKMNNDLRPAGVRPLVANSPVKELKEIRIGYEYAVLPGTRMPSGTGRYLPPAPAPARAEAEKTETPRAPTLSGRWSEPGFYLVLPFRISLVVESRYAGEFIRRLKGTESCLSVSAFRMKPLVERSREPWAARRDVYGSQGIVLLDVVGESLVFQLDGGRVTTLPSAKPPAAPPAKA